MCTARLFWASLSFGFQFQSQHPRCTHTLHTPHPSTSIHPSPTRSLACLNHTHTHTQSRCSVSGSSSSPLHLKAFGSPLTRTFQGKPARLLSFFLLSFFYNLESLRPHRQAIRPPSIPSLTLFPPFPSLGLVNIVLERPFTNHQLSGRSTHTIPWTASIGRRAQDEPSSIHTIFVSGT